jgi:hypothetical protein
MYHASQSSRRSLTERVRPPPSRARTRQGAEDAGAGGGGAKGGDPDDGVRPPESDERYVVV